jgi:hypothetical protein
MAMTKEEWRELLATKRSISPAESTARVWFAILALIACAVALVPSVYILVAAIEFLPRWSLTLDGPFNHITYR